MIFNDLANKIRLPLSTEPTVPGYRAAQLGAIHAVCGHFWDKTRPALVVMPTGSGKTAVMLTTSITLRASRTLIVAPSILLRDQLAENFSTLDTLRGIGAIELLSPNPKVHKVTKRITSKRTWNSLRKSDVIVGTPSSISPSIDGIPLPPTDLFDLILFDEAHHVPARSYTAIAEAFPDARKVLFTATPFRRDEREIRADLIFTYELSQAKRDGVFGKLRYIPIKSSEGQSPDEAIACAAAQQLKQDRDKGLLHRIMVRASSLSRADELSVVYGKCTNLRLKRVHSGLSSKSVRKAIEELRNGEIDGVIAVDMLGEGFDLPHLKVAALHSPHRSLAVTLQFIGRFARTRGPEFGEATFFASPEEVTGEAERLFVPGAEWNEIVEDLAHQRLEGEHEIRETVANFGPTTAEIHQPATDREKIQSQIWSLSPFFHAKVYEVSGPIDLAASLAVPANLEPLVVQVSRKESTLIWIGREVTPLRWSTHEGWADISHEMFIVVYIPSDRLMFICATLRENSVYDALVESVAGDAHRRLAPDEVNRVLNGIENQELFSLGMRNRAGTGGAGAESYKMLAGRSADKAIRAADGAIYDQGHAFCRGVENGKNVTIGFSTGSKIWTNRWDNISELLKWFRHVSKKIRACGNLQHRSMFDKLGVASRTTTMQQKIIAVDLPPDAYLRPSAKIQTEQDSGWLIDTKIEIRTQSTSAVDLVLQVGSVKLSLNYALLRRPLFSSDSSDTLNATVMDSSGRHHEPLLSYLNEHPPVFYLEDLSSVIGDTMSRPPSFDDSSIADQVEGVDWSALGVNPQLEKPQAGSAKKSLFEYVEDRLRAEGAEVVFADDSSNEIADYIAVFESPEQVRVQLFHCKSADKFPIPGDRVEELYEVIGQAVKCRR